MNATDGFRTNGLATVRSLWDATLDLLFPPTCCNCAAPLRDHEGPPLLCQPCQNLLAPAGSVYCRRCGAVVGCLPDRVALNVAIKAANEEDEEHKGEAVSGENTPNEEADREPTVPCDTHHVSCRFCRKRRFPFAGVWALGKYEDELRRAVLRMKDMRDPHLCRALAELLVARFRDEIEPLQFGAVVSVPSHWTRRVYRGAPSPEWIARAIAASLGIPFLRGALRVTRRMKTQSRLSIRKRFENVKGALAIRRRYDFKNLRILVVDDILTTGATCNEIARVLWKAGAKKVAVAVLARSQNEFPT